MIGEASSRSRCLASPARTGHMRTFSHDAAAAAAASCENVRMWPVLAGEARQRDLLLASPIILYDYPAIAPESPRDLCDATEIDEILALRVMTLTDEEKREA